MALFIDMVHDNPGEPPFETRYRNPQELARLGLNGQVSKHIHTAVPFDFLDEPLFSGGSEERLWFDAQIQKYRQEISQARDAGLEMYYHIDLFLFPKKLVERFRDAMCQNDRISLGRSKTRELLRGMLEELFELFPDLSGLVIRVGETYLHGLPHHCGNSAVKYGDDIPQEQQEFVDLITLLRDVVCVEQDRKLIFRTWDLYPDRFHGGRDYYLAVTDQIEPHGNLIFSIKHTAIDFWRHVNWNTCLGQGRHQQIVEVQIQREYEGKGAYPNYPVAGILEGFPEVREPCGLREFHSHPHFAGVYSWSRGGGWYGPYIQDEFWIDLNMEVLAEWVKNPERSERDCFESVATGGLGLESGGPLHRLCLLANEAVLKGRYCAAYDQQFNGECTPTCLWMRDDHLGGKAQLGELFQWLQNHNCISEALAEKAEAVELWEQIAELAAQIQLPDERKNETFHAGVEYGLRLFRMIYEGWRVLSEDVSSLNSYQRAFDAYNHLPNEFPASATLYQSDRRVGKHQYSKGDESQKGFDQFVHWVFSSSRPIYSLV